MESEGDIKADILIQIDNAVIHRLNNKEKSFFITGSFGFIVQELAKSPKSRILMKMWYTSST